MKNIKRIAGDILLIFYWEQRKIGSAHGEIIRFDISADGKVTSFNCNSQLQAPLAGVADGSSVDAYNAVQYLFEKNLIEGNRSDDTGGTSIFNLRVSAQGIDVIEGIERGEEEKRIFNTTFNIKLSDNINVESLIKAEVGNLLKAAII